MNIVAVDDEQQALSLLCKAIQKAVPGEMPACFSTAEEMLGYAKKTRVDIAFLDIHLGGINGLDLAKALAEIKPDTNIVFVTGYGQYMDEAYKMYVSGYVRKPVRVDRIQRELAHLRYPLAPVQNVGQYTFERTARRVYLGELDLLLTPREYAIFELLAGNPGTFYTSSELYTRAFGQSANDELGTLYTHISRLRKKLGLDNTCMDKGVDIEQQRGKGYRFVTKNYNRKPGPDV